MSEFRRAEEWILPGPDKESADYNAWTRLVAIENSKRHINLLSAKASLTDLNRRLTFGSGVYIGIYAAQNYDVPKLEDPQHLAERLKDYLNQYKIKDDK